MFELHGPTYKYNGEKLTKPEIIFINDHCFDEYGDQCFHVKTLLDNSTCDPKLHTVVFDHILHDDELSEYNLIYFPIFLASECQEFIEQDIHTFWERKTRIFNFSINKPRKHRKFLLREIERLGLTSYRHSLAWKYNQINDIKVTDYKFGPETQEDFRINNGSFKNAFTYDKLLKPIFQETCISIITEPCFYEKEALVTEKTIMAFMGGTIPIWFGGWRNAKALSKLGFDVFEDLVDHSYETLEDPYERCTQSLERNLHLFDLEKMQKIIKDNQHRLQYNLELLMSNTFLQKCFAQVRQSQEPLRSSLLQIMSTFRYNQFQEQVVEFSMERDKNV
jgi:hypothetical protein